MITHEYDDKTRTLIVADEGKEIIRYENLPTAMVKSVLASFVVQAQDGESYAYSEAVEGYEEKAIEIDQTVKLVDPAECPAHDCPMRTQLAK